MLSTFGKVVVAAIYGLWALWAFSARADASVPRDGNEPSAIAKDRAVSPQKFVKSVLLLFLLATSSTAQAAGYIRFECASNGRSHGGFRATVSGATLVHVTPGTTDRRLSGHLNVNLFQGRKKIAALRNISVGGSLGRSAAASVAVTLRAQNLTLRAEIDGASPSWLILADETVFGTDQAQSLPLTCRKDQ